MAEDVGGTLLSDIERSFRGRYRRIPKKTGGGGMKGLFVNRAR
jgi:hypothetical protein